MGEVTGHLGSPFSPFNELGDILAPTPRQTSDLSTGQSRLAPREPHGTRPRGNTLSSAREHVRGLDGLPWAPGSSRRRRAADGSFLGKPGTCQAARSAGKSRSQAGRSASSRATPRTRSAPFLARLRSSGSLRRQPDLTCGPSRFAGYRPCAEVT